jgi:hypothetical protein
VDAGKLLVAPVRKLTDDQVAYLKANRDELLRLVEISRWDGVDFTPLEPDWQAGPVQLVEGVVVDLGEVGLGKVAFSPRAIAEIEAWNGQISEARRQKVKKKGLSDD